MSKVGVVAAISGLVAALLLAFAPAASAQAGNLEVNAKGDTGTEQLKVTVSGDTVATFDLSTDWGTYRASVPTGVDADDVVVAFVNANAKRGVLVDNIVLDGDVYETESESVLTLGSANPTSDCKQGYLETEDLACRGQFVFPTNASSVLASSSDQSADETWATHCGDITSNTTWSAATVHVVDCPVTVTAGKQLTIQAGAIVKFEPQETGAGIVVANRGVLLASGSGNQPVVFTSNYDDARGGDTNGSHRSSSTLRPGRYGTAVTISPGSRTVLNGVVVDYASVGIADLSSSDTADAILTLTNSTIQNSYYLGVNFDEATTHTLVARTTFADNRLGAARLADGTWLHGFTVSGWLGNHFKGEPAARQLFLGGVEVEANTSWSINNDRGAIITLEKPRSLVVNGKFTASAGSIIKVTTSTKEAGIFVEDGGNVRIQGQSSKPVILSSVLDDTAGGDTNADGDNTKPKWGKYGMAISVAPGSNVSADHLHQRYGRNGIIGQPGDSDKPATVRVNNSKFEHNKFFGVHISKAPIAAQMYSNEFNNNRLGGARFAQGNSPDGFGTNGGGANTFTGNDSNNQLWMGGATIPANRTFVMSPESGAVLTLEHKNSLVTEGTFVAEPGSIIKVSSNNDNAGLFVMDGGQAYLNGTSNNKVIITSAVDDANGGDHDPDGDGVAPKAGNYRTAAWVSGGGTLQIQHAEIAYGRKVISDLPSDSGKTAKVYFDNVLIRDSKTFAIEFKESTTEAQFRRTTIDNSKTALKIKAGTVRFRGTITNSESGIIACSTGCKVDANYTDWGTPDGPFDEAGEPLACGLVTVAHWIGQPTWDPNTQYVNGNCDGSPLS